MNDVVAVPALTMPALLNRERAILEFNRRVLAQARRADVPLLERLRYVCIVSSNMDEFFEVRFADYLEAARRPGAGVSSRDLASVAADAHALIDDQYAVFNDDVAPKLKGEGIVILNHADRDDAHLDPGLGLEDRQQIGKQAGILGRGGGGDGDAALRRQRDRA